MADDSSTQALLERYEHLKGTEHHKNVLIEVSRDREPLFHHGPNIVFFFLQRIRCQRQDLLDMMVFLISE